MTEPTRATADANRTAPVEAFRRGPREFLDVGHSRLAYYRFGSGPDVVFIHGWPLNSATFRNLVPLLSDRFTCHLFDLPGSGHTETGADAPLTLRGQVDTVRRALRTLGLSRYALLSHDSGGFIARMIAADDPSVSGLVLGNTEIPGHTPALIPMYSRLVGFPGFARAMRAVLKVGPIRRSPLGFGNVFESPASIDGEFTELIVEPAISSAHAMQLQLELLRGLDFHLVETELLAAHPRIRAKTLLVWGTDDIFFPVEKARAMVPQFKAGATFTEIPGGRLLVHEERAREFAEPTLRFLGECFDLARLS